jgi:hypothetical protein
MRDGGIVVVVNFHSNKVTDLTLNRGRRPEQRPFNANEHAKTPKKLGFLKDSACRCPWDYPENGCQANHFSGVGGQYAATAKGMASKNKAAM